MNNPINISAIRDTATTVLRKISENVPKMLQREHSSDCGCGCCPPKQHCPPHCILSIHRTAYAGERIIVPFKIKNTHSTTHTYMIGHWPLMDESGNTAPQQPVLSKTSVTLAPNQVELVFMTIDLISFKTGQTYNMEIVLREEKFNQNICFSLFMGDSRDVPVAKPWDEHIVYPKFLDWQTHFTCPGGK